MRSRGLTCGDTVPPSCALGAERTAWGLGRREPPSSFLLLGSSGTDQALTEGLLGRVHKSPWRSTLPVTARRGPPASGPSVCVAPGMCMLSVRVDGPDLEVAVASCGSPGPDLAPFPRQVRSGLGGPERLRLLPLAVRRHLCVLQPPHGHRAPGGLDQRRPQARGLRAG